LLYREFSNSVYRFTATGVPLAARRIIIIIIIIITTTTTAARESPVHIFQN
jgi:hypothetical protein